MQALKRVDKALKVSHEGGTMPNMSDQFAPATWDLSSTIIGFGLCAREAIPLSFLAFLVIGLVMVFNGRIGAQLHVSFPVIARSSFASAQQGGRITAVMIGAIWPSFLRLKNTLPEGLGINTQEMIGFFVLFCFQAPLACVPVVRLKWFFAVKAWISAIGFLGLFIWALYVTKGQGQLLTGHVGYDPTLLPKGSKAWACLASLNAVTGLYSTVSINIPDFARFSRSPKSSWSQALAVPITGTIPIAVAILCAQAALTQKGAAVYDPASLCALFDSRAARFFAAFSFFVSTIGVNISANSISFATDCTSILPRYLSIFRCSVLAGGLCWLTCPWMIVTDAPSFYAFLSSYPTLLAPVATILGADFYFVRKGKVDVRQLYEENGIYAYKWGVNWRAIAAWACAFAPNSIGFAHAVDSSNPDAQPFTYFIAWYVASFVALCCYLALSFAFPPRSSFVEEAVYEVSQLDYDQSAATSTADKPADEDKEHISGVVPV
ncbi:hypothetical protein JCM10213v2_007449 [Rhodosporidiobolus nylandii]